ncbi:TPA: tail fiber assembly protein [Pseudomonas aeruginosa]|uniref:tail fiber assembly protein n=1 Tax=Pseudomonas aeruginosa TaxID=287 RepID=UPI000B9B2193|nr:tail fiber assembly protein [Pseudomonas aeruginosa]MBF3056970.1 hypothetical protein [Pseudomonas aeruginosa]MDC9027111.1 tail fiber assembly protein [Pseudomonas aeruginosa]OXT77170.1 hypothetical protein CF344_01775 [Pseudomonas aeruginosa]TQI24195.1 tail fiber assembly protein [Pseudomonas aeruginosa]
MKTYARIQDNFVVEFYETDRDIATVFHPDLIWVDVSDIEPSPDYRWTAEQVDGVWFFAEPVIVLPTEAELKTAAIWQRDVLLGVANEATAGMADAFIAGLLDEADTATFKAYAAYKLALNKVDQQVGYPQAINWPVSPG